jgi:hypothetical protein
MNTRSARFNRLVRLFSHRLVESEMLAEDAEPHQTFVTIFSLLGAVGLLFGILEARRFLLVFDHVPRELRLRALWSDQLVLLLLSMAATGFLCVLAWDAMLPGRKDALVLGSLPIRARTLFAARLCALATFFFLFTNALNAVPGLLLPTLSITRADWLINWLQLALAQFAATMAACALVMLTAIALQAAMMVLLPWRIFQGASSVIQIGFLLGSFAVLFITPGTEHAVKPESWWAQWLPPYWFVGLWQQLGGLPQTFPPAFAARAVLSVGVAAGAAALLMPAASGIAMKKIVEGLEKRRGGPGTIHRVISAALDGALLRKSGERAVFWFSLRTLLRHRGRRLLLGLYVGLGIACAMWGVSESMLRKERWAEPKVAACLVLVQFMVLAQIGVRALYALPVDPKANWVFRMSGGSDPSGRLAGARKLLVCAGMIPIPILVVVYMAAWGIATGAVFALLSSALAWSMGEWLTREQRMIPFTCRMAPGNSNVKVKLGAWAFAFFGFTTFWASLAVSVLSNRRWAQVIAMLLVTIAPGAWVAWGRWRSRAHREPLIFEEAQAAEVEPIRLSS